MLENIRLAFKGIWSHKMRSFLTMLGIIIGIAAIIAIVSTIKGTNDQIKRNLIGSGNNTVRIIFSQGGYEYQIYDSSAVPRYIPQISSEEVQEIGDLDDVEEVTIYNSRYVSDGVFYKNKSLSDLMIHGIEENYFSTCDYVIKAGRSFLEEDYKEFRTVMILDRIAAQNLFADENPIGKTVEIASTPFTVIGIVEERNAFEPEIETMEDYYTFVSESNGLLYVPKAVWPIIYSYDEPEMMTIRAASTDAMTKIGRKAADILNDKITTGNTNTVKYKAKDAQEEAASLQHLANAQNMQLIWIAGISLLVGGIGVMNIMLVSVTERTNEIGLKKAIGARKGAILAQFLTEAAVLTSLGGFLGVAAGVGAAQVIHRISNVSVAIDIPASIIAVVFSMVIGLTFGFLPSVQAANLDPIEALRRE